MNYLDEPGAEAARSDPASPLKTPSFPLIETTRFVQRVIHVIYEHIGDASFDVSLLARSQNLSISQLNRRLHQADSVPAGALIRDIRMQYGAYLLRHTEEKVHLIALSVGYPNPASFCRSFKKLFGCTPREFASQRAEPGLDAPKASPFGGFLL